MKTIGEVGKVLGITVHTLRYYEQIGLIQRVARSGGRRVYSEADMAWLKFIQHLKDIKMSLREIKRFAALRYAGDHTIPERRAMLMGHQNRLLEEMASLQAHMDALKKKLKMYDDMTKRHDRSK